MLFALALALAPQASAAEMVWNGHYTARGTAVDSLSLSSENENAEGLSALFEHRAVLAPTLAVTPNIAFHSQLRILSNETWGASANAWSDTSGDAIPTVFADGVAESQGVSLATAWADVYTSVGRLRFGRMPLEWGAGVLLNPGNQPDSEYGDVSDRVQFTTQVGGVFVMGAWDMVEEGYIGLNDDFQIANAAIAYQSEVLALGLLNRYRFQPSQDFGAYTGDVWGKAALGSLSAELELAIEIGGGDLSTGENDISIFAWGGALNLAGEMCGYLVGFELGIASGDTDPNDGELTTFSFDRDYNRSILMFESPMPVLAANVMNSANGGREYDAVRLGDGISNAQYIRPWVGYSPMEGLDLEAAWFAARADQLPESETERSYGSEYSLTARWRPYDNFELDATGALFTPGGYFSAYEHSELGGGFDALTYGGRLMATVEF